MPRVLIPAILLTALLSAEPPKTLIQGRVSDETGAAIVGARVLASPSSGRTGVTASTNHKGEFALPLDPGAYQFQVMADGFADHRQDLTVAEASPAPLQIALRILEQRTTITVSEAAGYQVTTTSTATKTPTALLDIPQSIGIVSRELIKDQMMTSMADAVRYIPGITMQQGEGHRDAPVIRGNATTADFFVNGVRDDVQYYRDLYNLDRVEAVKGPNAMIFGRGGGGGVLNRVTKEAGFMPLREIYLQGGSFGNRRASADFNHSFGEKFAFRMNGLYENSNSFRNYFNVERYGIAPTVTILPDSVSRLKLAYEFFSDERIVDRGVPSFQGRPHTPNRSVFFGNPNDSHADAKVHLGSATYERQIGSLNLRNSTLFGGYDKFYRNVFPGSAVNAAGTALNLSAYDNATQRLNVFNQTDATFALSTGAVRHTLLAGAEFGRQATDNLRNTGYFNNTSTALPVPWANPTDFTPVTYRQSATDANNRPINTIAATYFQDQVHLSRYVLVTGGVRFDRFDLRVLNNRNGETRRRLDNMVSPRAGVVVKPVNPLSLYANYSVSYLPSSGDQFASLDATTETLKPEKFTNYEAGVKWDIRRYLSLTTALYRLDRTNTRAVDPNNPAIVVQTGSQRTNGYEFNLSGSVTRAWTVAGGYGYQDAYISSATAAARLGAKVAQVPHHTFSLWNNYQIFRRLGAGLGLIHQADMFAAFDNTVVIPSFTRADAAVFFSITEKVRLQANVENITDNQYFVNAHTNNNITPGTMRTARLGMTVRF